MKSRRLAFDTNALIYFLDRVSPYTAWLDPVFRSIRDGESEAIVSVISESEVLVKPFRLANREALGRATVLLSQPRVGILDVDRETGWKAARIRADLDLKLPDALIVATAIISDCDALIGNDKTCSRRVTEIPYIYLDEAVKA